MEFFSIIALGISAYTLYEIHLLKEKDSKNQEKTMKKELNIHKQLKSLIDQHCEIIVKDTMIHIDIPYKTEGIILDVDDEWVVIFKQNGKKKNEKIIRISLIEDVKQIHK